MGTIRQGAAAELWQSLVREACTRCGQSLDEAQESYLVFVLLRHQRDGHLLARTQALEWLEAQVRVGSARSDALRDVGDRCLLIAGLYPQQAQRRLVGLDYFLALGSQAYTDLASAARSVLAGLYGRLAESFARLVRVLVEVRRLGSGCDAIGALDRHALCLADPSGAALEFPGTIVIAGGSAKH